MNRKHQKWMAMACAAAMATSAGAATIVRTGRTNPEDPAGAGDVTTDETWTSDNVYVLNGIIFVQDGATLTVNAGTLIRGEDVGPGNRPGAIIVTRNSKIRMLGTKDQPIVMTNMDDDHFVGPSPEDGSSPWTTQNNGITETWGGLLVLGKCYIASAVSSPNASNFLQIEGTTPYGDLTKYGGDDDDDDSGVIRHVSIRYGGYVLGGANEINGLSMGAVGRGTTIEHVEIFENKDDGFEWFGGTVNTKYLVNWCNGDDSFDWDEGFRGKGQFWMTVQGPLSTGPDRSDKGAEQDGGNNGDGNQPSSIGTVYNATYVGLGKGTTLKNAALHFRDGSGGRYYNSLFLDFGGACALIEGLPTDADHTAGKMTTYNYAHTKPGSGQAPTGNGGAGLSGYIGYDHELGGKMLEMQNCVFWKFGYTNAFGCVANGTGIAGAYGAEHGGTKTDGNKAHYGLDTGYDLFAASRTNTYISEVTLPDGPLAAFGRAVSAVDIDGTLIYPVEYINPNLPAGSPYLASSRSVPDDGFYTPVDFVGAFDDERNWASWTLAARSGLIEIEPETVKTDYDDPFIESEHLTYTVAYNAEAASLTYKVWHTESLSPANWTVIDTRSGVTGVQTMTDTREIAGSGFYKVTKE